MEITKLLNRNIYITKLSLKPYNFSLFLFIYQDIFLSVQLINLYSIIIPLDKFLKINHYLNLITYQYYY